MDLEGNIHTLGDISLHINHHFMDSNSSYDYFVVEKTVDGIISCTAFTYGKFCFPLELCTGMSVAFQTEEIPTSYIFILCIAN